MENKVIDLYLVRHKHGERGLIEIFYTEELADKYCKMQNEQGADCRVEYWVTGDHLFKE